MKFRKSEKKRDVSRLQVAARRTADGRHITEYLYSVTGGNTVERRNFLIEIHYTRDDPGYSSTRNRWDESTGKRITWTEVLDPPHKKGDYVYERRTETRQKFLCVGGPLAGKRCTGQDAAHYLLFNCASSRWGKYRETENRVVLVHESVLKG